MSADHGSAVALVHATVVVVPSAVLAGSVVRELRRAAVVRGQRLPGPAALLAGAATAVASAVHVVAAASHTAHLTVVAFLLLVAAGQALWACAVLSGGAGAAVLRQGAHATLGLLALWAVTRTTGLPVGPHTEVEPVGVLDLLAVACQLVAVGATGHALGAGAAQPALRSAAG